MPPGAVAQAQAQSPADHPHVDTGLAVTVGQVLHGQGTAADPQDWYASHAGVTRARLLHIALVVLLGEYRTAREAAAVRNPALD